MPTSRPLVEGDRVVAISLPLTVGETYIFAPRRMNPEHVVLCSDFYLHNRGINNWWKVVGAKVFGITNCTTHDARLHNAIRRGTAPALYVRDGDTVEPWNSYQAVLLDRRMRALTERHQAFINRLRQHGAGNIQLRVEDDIVILQCSGGLPDPAILTPNIPDGVRVEALPAQSDRRTTNDGLLPTYEELEQITRVAYQRVPGGSSRPSTRYPSQERQANALIDDQTRRLMTERWAATMNIPISISAAELAEIGITPPPPPPPPPTRFNLLECDLPAVDPTPVTQKHFDALAELQASFRAAKVAAKTAIQPVLTRFDLLECDEPVVPVTVRPKWAPTQRTQPQPPRPERRTVEDILDLTTSGPLEALAALQIVKAEIVRDLWQRETN